MDSEVESVEVPASVAEIGAYAFYACKRLRRVEFARGSRLRRIGCKCFCSTGIERIAIPAGVDEIQEDAFKMCAHLEEVVFEEGSASCRRSGLASAASPRGVRCIAGLAFKSCESLCCIRLPDGLERIGAECFKYSGLETIVFSPSVREVGAGAFSHCK